MGLNNQEGGLLAAKVISEFGVVGVLGTLAFTVFAFFAGLRLRRIATHPGSASVGDTLALSIVVAFTINVFVRGVAYFDGTTLLFAAACFYLHEVRSARRPAGLGWKVRLPRQQAAATGESPA